MNNSLNKIASSIGEINFDKFHDSGYRGLYNGESAGDIAKRKELRYREDITEAKLKIDNITREINANIAHYNMVKIIIEKKKC